MAVFELLAYQVGDGLLVEIGSEGVEKRLIKLC